MVRRLEWREGRLGRNGADVHRVELGVSGVRVPDAPAPIPRAAPELLVRRKGVDQVSEMLVPMA